MRKRETILPTTVVDQIRLWEQEGNRVKASDGFLYDDFSATSDFELVRDYAKQLEVLLWELPSRRKLFVTTDGHSQVRFVLSHFAFPGPTLIATFREFIKRKMAAAAEQNE